MANANKPTFFSADYNGHLYVPGGAGEAEDEDTDTILWWPRREDFQNGTTFPLSSCLNQDIAKDGAANIYAVNYWYLKRHYPTWTDMRTRVVSWYRAIISYAGLVSPEEVPNTHNCTYNLCRRLNWPLNHLLFNNYAVKRTAMLAVNAAAVINPTTVFDSATVATYDVNIKLDDALANELYASVYDVICHLAFLFRARGHHWQASYEERANSLFKGTNGSRGRDKPTDHVSWEDIHRRALKAIFPDVLDAFWVKVCEEQKCSAPLAIRVNCAPAGAASLFAIKKGCDDLCTAFPALTDRFEEAIRYLMECIDELSLPQNRWAGSINHNKYGVAKFRYEEQRLAPLASVIMSALNDFCPDAPLAKSKAMQRTANAAPITGSVMAQILNALAKSEIMILQYVPKKQ
jgi:hypothetical protein